MHILDTGPIFKFLTTDCVPQLLGALGNEVVNVPQAVEHEIFDTPTRHRQFKHATDVWRKVPDRFKNVIPDVPTDDLRELCETVLGTDFDTMYSHRKDRGENMAILHGVLLARAGEKVLLVCDEEAGTQLIKKQARLLAMQHVQGQHTPGGKIEHADTLTLLSWAIEGGYFDSREHFLKKYHAMATLDEALPRDVSTTDLLKSPPWP
jgi:hypothetical protein